ncbi:hypothetical protein [Marisediminicola sp. LYQ85]|uniref:hypothetical protein n=1 Tax=Marisediminicola sp. LYQ85 TaxID=3391062 RepID=UPI0039836C21
MTGWSTPEENTLGVIFSRRNRGVPRASVAAAAVRQANARWSSLGTGYLGVGAAALCAVEAVYGLASFATHLTAYPSLIPAIAAWVVFIAAFAAMSMSLATRGERLPGWAFGLYYLALAVVAALDLVAIWPLGDVGAYATASVTAGFGLLIVAVHRPARELAIGTTVLVAALVTTIILTTEMTPEMAPEQVLIAVLAGFPAFLAVSIVRNFRTMVQLELDRVLVQSTVSAPRFAVGMLASEELARLDLAAEELLDSVASGRTALPLRPKTASTAASLATELRLHLIEGRRETWLYHAVSESELLGRAVTLVDPSSLAGLLTPAQRDGLLSAVWVIVADHKKTGATATITLGPVLPRTAASPARSIAIPIAISTTSVARNRVDSSTWAALGRVGAYTHSVKDSSLRVKIECHVPNPADQ